MKRIFFSGLVGLAIMLVIACNKGDVAFDSKLESGDYLIFGIYHGECIGDCMRLFKLADGAVYADDRDWGFEQPIPFMSDPLGDAAFLLAEPLYSNFPDALLASDKEIYGCPDCADQGGYYLELRDDGKTQVWRIDTRDDEQGMEILTYKELLAQVLNELL